jgi:thioredoxin reductase
MTDEPLDTLIVGGGPAGLTAALYLGRSRKSVRVLDRGSPRHSVSDGVHNFLTREGVAPAALRAIAWEQMAAYPAVAHQQADVHALTWADGHWHAHTDDGVVTAHTALLATGVIDEHPEIPGFRERWAHSIHQCPYCHGWEMRDRPLAVLASGPAAAHLPALLRGWTDDVVLLTHGGEVDAETRTSLHDLGIPVYDAPVAALEGPGRALTHVVLTDGTRLARQGLFSVAPQRQVALVQDLGLDLDDMGYVSVDAFGATSRERLWAAGDLTTRGQQVVLSAAQGAAAAIGINAALTLHG